MQMQMSKEGGFKRLGLGFVDSWNVKVWVWLQMQMSREGESMRLGQIMHPFVSLATSMLLGVGSGMVLSTYVGSRFSLWGAVAPATRRLPPYVSQR